jgi:hypothetical protein
MHLEIAHSRVPAKIQRHEQLSVAENAMKRQVTKSRSFLKGGLLGCPAFFRNLRIL